MSQWNILMPQEHQKDVIFDKLLSLLEFLRLKFWSMVQIISNYQEDYFLLIFIPYVTMIIILEAVACLQRTIFPKTGLFGHFLEHFISYIMNKLKLTEVLYFIMFHFISETEDYRETLKTLVLL